jgi:hypothetical protein
MTILRRICFVRCLCRHITISFQPNMYQLERLEGTSINATTNRSQIDVSGQRHLHIVAALNTNRVTGRYNTRSILSSNIHVDCHVPDIGDIAHPLVTCVCKVESNRLRQNFLLPAHSHSFSQRSSLTSAVLVTLPASS